MKTKTKYLTKKRRAIIFRNKFIAIVSAIAISSSIIGYASQIEAYEMPKDEPITALRIYPETDPIKAYVLKKVYEAGLNPDEVECIIDHESGWDNWRYNINSNGTTDMGLWQINSIHKGTISVKDRFDYKEATKWAIAKRLHDGNWNAWVGYNQCRDLAKN